MSTEVYPRFLGQTASRLGISHLGGEVVFTIRALVQFIHFEHVDMSVWIKNMDIHTSPTTIAIYCDGTAIWTGVIDSNAARTQNGYTLPKRVFDLGRPRMVDNIVITANNQNTPNNHEFFMWAPSYITVSIYS